MAQQQQTVRTGRISSSSTSKRSVITNMPGMSHMNSNPAHQREKRVRLANTFQTSPRHIFPEKRVQDIIKETLETIVGEKEYEAEECRMMSGEISNLVKSRVRQLGCPRYKIVCTVTLCQRAKNCVKHVSRCVWNPSHDTFVEEEFENKSILGVVCVYAIYTD